MISSKPTGVRVNTATSTREMSQTAARLHEYASGLPPAEPQRKAIFLGFPGWPNARKAGATYRKIWTMFKFLIAILTLTSLATPQSRNAEPPAELLWPSGAPGALGNEDADRPSLTIYLPSGHRTRTAVVVCPGGGY